MHTAQKMNFSIKVFFSKCEQTVDLVTFTEEILYGKLHFSCSGSCFTSSRPEVILKFSENSQEKTCVGVLPCF